MTASKHIEHWPEESREAAQLVIDHYGEPDEATPSQLVWHRRGEWNLMHDIVAGEKSVDEARAYCAKEFADYRRKLPTPYMEQLRFASGTDTADPDERVLSDEDLKRASEEGRRRQSGSGR